MRSENHKWWSGSNGSREERSGKMKKSIGIVVLSLIVAMCVSTGALGDTINAEYNFEGNGNDDSGNGHPGSLVGIAEYSASGTGHGGGQALNPNGDYFSVADNSDLDITNDIFVEAWVNASSIPSGNICVVKKYDSRTTSDGYYMYYLFINSSGMPQFNVNVVGSNRVGVSATSALTLDTWVHLRGTYDGTNVSITVDSTTTSAACTGLIKTNNEALVIGGCARNENFDGLIDGVKVGVVPEPATMALLLAGLPLALRRRKR